MPDVTAISVPIGTVISYVGRLETVNQLASEGWLLCDGRSIPSTQYPELLVAVGTVLADGPPHRSQRAEFPHWAPVMGTWRRTALRAKGA
jgi:hypothetical protein